jgi:hypothetical protein
MNQDLIGELEKPSQDLLIKAIGDERATKHKIGDKVTFGGKKYLVVLKNNKREYQYIGDEKKGESNQTTLEPRRIYEALPKTELDPNGFIPLKSLGSNMVLCEKNNKRFVRKSGTSIGHTATEALAMALYNKLGVPVPKCQFNLKNGLMYNTFIEGMEIRVLKKGTDAYNKTKEALQKGFAVDALLGNTDVIGPKGNNVLCTFTGDEAIPIRTNLGSIFDFKNDGRSRMYGDDILDFDSLRDPKVNKEAAEFFSDISDNDIYNQLRTIQSEFKQQVVKLGAMKDGLGTIVNTKRLANTLKSKFQKAIELFEHRARIEREGVEEYLSKKMEATPYNVETNTGDDYIIDGITVPSSIGESFQKINNTLNMSAADYLCIENGLFNYSPLQINGRNETLNSDQIEFARMTGLNTMQIQALNTALNGASNGINRFMAQELLEGSAIHNGMMVLEEGKSFDVNSSLKVNNLYKKYFDRTINKPELQKLQNLVYTKVLLSAFASAEYNHYDKESSFVANEFNQVNVFFNDNEDPSKISEVFKKGQLVASCTCTTGSEERNSGEKVGSVITKNYTSGIRTKKINPSSKGFLTKPFKPAYVNKSTFNQALGVLTVSLDTIKY